MTGPAPTPRRRRREPAKDEPPDATELERLRDALEKIALMTPPAGASFWTHKRAADGYWTLFDRARVIAYVALHPLKPQP